jgi:hypothetical protein
MAGRPLGARLPSAHLSPGDGANQRSCQRGREKVELRNRHPLPVNKDASALTAVAVICLHEPDCPLQPAARSIARTELVVLTQFDHESARPALEKNGLVSWPKDRPVILGSGSVKAAHLKGGQQFVSSHVP